MAGGHRSISRERWRRVGHIHTRFGINAPSGKMIVDPTISTEFKDELNKSNGRKWNGCFTYASRARSTLVLAFDRKSFLNGQRTVQPQIANHWFRARDNECNCEPSRPWGNEVRECVRHVSGNGPQPSRIFPTFGSREPDVECDARRQAARFVHTITQASSLRNNRYRAWATADLWNEQGAELR